MATSLSSDFILTRDQVVTRAYQIIGKVQDGEAPASAQLTEGGEILNTILYEKANDGVFTHQLDWTTNRFVLATARDGTDGFTYRCVKSHTSATANRPITGDDWPLYWVLDSSATSLGAWGSAQSYISGGEYAAPTDALAMWDAFIRDDDSNDHPVEVISMARMRAILDRGLDTSTWPAYAALDSGFSAAGAIAPRVWVYPIPTVVTASIVWQKVRKLYDVDSGSNDIDLWSRCLRWLIYELANDLADKAHLGLDERMYIQGKAALFRQRMHQGGQLEVEEESGVIGSWEA